MEHNVPPAQRQPDGDLLIPAQTAQLLQRLLDDLEMELNRSQGQVCAAPGEMESLSETANRQDFVDKLSASAGVHGPTVQARQMASTSYLTDNSASLELLKALRRLLS